RSIWSRNQTRPICDDFAEQPNIMDSQLELAINGESCGYHTCSSAASTNSSKQQQLYRTQDMELADETHTLATAVGNLEWEMFMMQHAQRLMPKTSSPISQRRDLRADLNSKSYHKWRNYLQSTPAHMLHNVSHIPEAIAGHFCPTDFPAFSDLEEMESAAKRYKVDTEATKSLPHLQIQNTISTDL
ncbi:uncharacterized protein LOC117784109, partial [Drosophila innubila]|uniref:uncharacterized protein LOC117784109 n=1 Tax=Drosophila innubila TaxID=198719 RepID=UPI00148CAB0A